MTNTSLALRLFHRIRSNGNEQWAAETFSGYTCHPRNSTLFYKKLPQRSAQKVS